MHKPQSIDPNATQGDLLIIEKWKVTQPLCMLSPKCLRRSLMAAWSWSHASDSATIRDAICWAILPYLTSFQIITYTVWSKLHNLIKLQVVCVKANRTEGSLFRNYFNFPRNCYGAQSRDIQFPSTRQTPPRGTCPLSVCSVTSTQLGLTFSGQKNQSPGAIGVQLNSPVLPHRLSHLTGICKH